jgi:DNA repair exonuclease SbcCD nuclease subunit
MILFTADLHIKLGQKNVPREWAKSRYYGFFRQVEIVSKSIDMHVVGGDIFDRMPTLEEVELYFEFVTSCIVPTFIYDGNHEATKKNSTFFSALKDVTSLVNPLVTVVDEITEYDWGTILPYCDLHKKKVFKGLNKTKPLFTHVRGEIPPHVKSEIDLSVFEDFPVVFAGDLHAHSNTQLNVVYPGSPMTTSFHRNLVETGYLLIDGTNWEWKPFELPQLVRKTVTDPSDMVETDYHHTIYEIEGNIADLADIKNTDLLDKKVVKRSTEATLILDPSMTISDELAEYFLYILELPEDKVTSLIGTFNDNSQGT